MNRVAYKNFIYATNLTGSQKAPSYVRALDLLGEMLSMEPFDFADCQNVWAVNSVERLQALYEFANEEKKKGDASVWNMDNIPKSYLQNGYCTAALRSLQEFLVEYGYEQELIEVFNKHAGDESEIPAKLDREIVYPECLLEGLDKLEGKEVIRSARTRTNQNVFRKIILEIYDQSCCITGLNQ